MGFYRVRWNNNKFEPRNISDGCEENKAGKWERRCKLENDIHFQGNCSVFQNTNWRIKTWLKYKNENRDINHHRSINKGNLYASWYMLLESMLIEYGLYSVHYAFVDILFDFWKLAYYLHCYQLIKKWSLINRYVFVMLTVSELEVFQVKIRMIIIVIDVLNKILLVSFMCGFTELNQAWPYCYYWFFFLS